MSVSTSADTQNHDWRIALFGDYIQVNDEARDEEEAPPSPPQDMDEEEAPPSPPKLVPSQQALTKEKYDYIAVFFGADYCPHCKEFAPTVKLSAPLLEGKRCKVIFVSNDRTQEAFGASCKKNAGIDVMPYNLDKTRAMRDLFDLQTIPALMILKNSHFEATAPAVITNARHLLVADPNAKNFPWVEEGPMTFMDRFIIRGKYGKWWDLGHHINPDFPDQIYMDEHAVRARAGLLNIMTWIAIINVFFWKEPDYVQWLFPIVAYEFITSMIVGLTPISPFGVLGTLMAIVLHPEPHWKPAKPKRFAWLIGFLLSLSCFFWVTFRKELGSAAYKPLVKATVITCNVATWFESSLGFCFGCFIYNSVVVPIYKLEECKECKL
jgi:thiol-disulfide isomerase/thioredoxin